ncbi:MULTISPECIES: hypothetical protein [Cryobacterium]|uniref:hypothetical protein n=1 Tax=Cryobacterium TaxID=69578 RepID=UPI000CD3F537|nr:MULTISPECIES: hypothetical protein [Cryobacterium]POH66061.1 hypothetical protein C3B60_09545 [Cryobacterium zongtaii]TFC46727.1 hypothetical protein E3O57_05680 [Cryobacterium sp. TMN-39-2]
MNQLHVDNTFSDALRAKLVNHVQSTAPAQRRRQTLLWSAAGVVVGAGLLGGVAAAAGGLLILPGSQPVTHEDFAQSSYHVSDTLKAFGSLTADYDPFNSPQELAAASQVIVEGTVVGLQKGRTTMVFDSVVLVLLPNDVVTGELAAGNDGNVYVELNGAGSPDPLYYAKALPSGAKVVAYMVPAGDGTLEEGNDVAIDNPKAGRPEGQALFLANGPQGYCKSKATTSSGPSSARMRPGTLPTPFREEA